jgi:hypothetical protein
VYSQEEAQRKTPSAPTIAIGIDDDDDDDDDEYAALGFNPWGR